MVSATAARGRGEDRPTRLARPEGTAPARTATSVSHAVMQFVVTGLVALALVAVGTTLLSRQASRDEALRDARSLTWVLGTKVIQPTLDDGVLAGDPAALARLDRVVRSRVILAPLVRVKIWTATGRIVYSDERRLIGSTYELGDHERDALRTGTTKADVSDLSEPENRFERGQGSLLEVYLPIHTPSGVPLLFETYSKLSSVSARSREVWLAFAPITFGALLLLQLVQVPLAWSMARRLRQGQYERERLLRRAIAASDAERRRIASDLHDGVVQELAGASFVLAGAADRAAAIREPEVSGALQRAAGGVRQSIRALRSLLVEIYPPNLRSAGLAAALSDLVAPLSSRGIETRLDLPPSVELPEEAEALVFRVAQEAIRNVANHAGACTAVVRLTVSSTCAVLTVIDDGQGFEPDAVANHPATGHFGLVVLRDIAADAGADLRLDSAPGQGTSVRLEMPLS
jgi:two-component system NarL family sensor kinase